MSRYWQNVTKVTLLRYTAKNVTRYVTNYSLEIVISLH